MPVDAVGGSPAAGGQAAKTQARDDDAQAARTASRDTEDADTGTTEAAEGGGVDMTA